MGWRTLPYTASLAWLNIIDILARHRVAITVTYQRVSKQVQFYNMDRPDEVMQDICEQVGLPRRTRIELADTAGACAEITGSLPSGVYGMIISAAPAPEHIIINVTYMSILVQVEFTRADSDAAVKEAICHAIGIPTGRILRLRRVNGPDVAITAALDNGEYEVLTPGPKADGTATPDMVMLDLIYNGISTRLKISKNAIGSVVKETICLRLRLSIGTPSRNPDPPAAAAAAPSAAAAAIFIIIIIIIIIIM